MIVPAFLKRRVPATGDDYEKTVNIFSDHMFNTKIEFRPPRHNMNVGAEALTAATPILFLATG